MPLWDLEPKSKLIGMDSYQSQWKALIRICQDLNFSQEEHNQFANLSVPTSFAKGSGIKCRERTSAKFLSRKGGISNSRRLWRCQITNQSPLGRPTLTIDVSSSEERRCRERKTTSRQQDDKVWSATDQSCRTN